MRTDRERADLLEALHKHRGLLRRAARRLTDEQAAARTTVSELCVGGVIKHVTATERRWADFMVRGAPAFAPVGADTAATQAATFRMAEDETLAGLLDDYEAAARRTDDLVRSLPLLDAEHPLPDAPWFEPGASWSARRVLLHLIAETAQHAGHADIIRESLDGAKTMG
jgi:uncharacterized damage-inducible protein DinB